MGANLQFKESNNKKKDTRQDILYFKFFKGKAVMQNTVGIELWINIGLWEKIK